MLVIAMGSALLLLIAGCSSQTGSGDGHGDHDHGASSQSGAPSQAADAAQGHNDADVSFATGMIPHHEQAVAMSDILLAKQGIDARVTDLARQIKAAQAPEIDTMKGWLSQWNVPADAGHGGHDMSDPAMRQSMGMMTDQQLDQLRAAQGVDATRQFLDGMIAHHEGAVRMAQTEVQQGAAADAKQLAQSIIETQQREIDTMKQILGTL
jgi:uncharacterized protein (DUF305 family)